MHPAFSVIFFTTASGAGYGLLAMLGTLGLFWNLPFDAKMVLPVWGAIGLVVTDPHWREDHGGDGW